jgi:replicative DNA helicase Mcm
MFPAFRKRLENKGIVLPPDISLFSALHMIERTQIGNTVKYDSNKHTDEFGHCYDDKTEILTEDGWKFFNTLLPSDKVAALEDGICKFVSPTSYIEQNYQGEMYKIKSKYLDLVVTPNHKIYVKNHLRLSQFGLIQVNELLKTQYQFKCDMKWTGIPKQWFYLPEYIKSTRGRTPYTKKSFIKTKHWDKIKIEMDTWLQFFGYFISEGFTSTQNRIGICQNKNDILIKMRECVKKTPFQWHEKRSRATISIRTKNIQLFQYLKQFGKASNKFIPKEIKQLPKKQLNILLQALIEGDGHEGKKGCVYSTISRRLADDVQEIALKCGYVARIGVWTNFAKNSKNISPLYYVTINKKMKHGVTPTIITHKSKHNHISKEMYKGKIYCVTVPSHIIYIRRNGKPCWCGNSDEAISLITACYVYEKEGNSTPLFKGNTSTKRENIFRAREKWRKR